MRQRFLALAVTASIFVLFSWGASADSPSLNQEITNHDVVIVGEQHRKPESTQWFSQVVSTYVKDGACLQVALEIGSDQQPALDVVMKGNTPVSSVRISPIIDHPSYRDMLIGFRKMVEAGRCLSLHAIDAPLGVSRNRDEWMAERIMLLKGDVAAIVLVGNLHALKQVAWHQEALGEPFLAERLQTAGVDVFSVLQRWPSGTCKSRHPRLVPVGEPEAHAVLAHILEPVAADVPEKPSGVFDAAVVWECQN